jgi:type IV pilus modification protein PilV
MHSIRKTEHAAPSGRRWLRARVGGVSLIEVLASLMVSSVGVLSLASLEVVSKRNLRDAGQRLQAAQLAYSLLERVRANSVPTALQAYVSGAAPSLGGGRLGDTPPSPNCSDSATSCTAEQMARFDLWHWEQLLDGATERLGNPDSGRKIGGLTLATVCLTPPATGAGQAGLYTLSIAFRGDQGLPEKSADTCGRAAVFTDGSRLYGDQDQYRRTVTVQAWIVPTASR